MINSTYHPNISGQQYNLPSRNYVSLDLCKNYYSYTMIENNLNKKSDLRNVNFEKSGDNPGGIVQSFPFPGR